MVRSSWFPGTGASLVPGQGIPQVTQLLLHASSKGWHTTPPGHTASSTTMLSTALLSLLLMAGQGSTFTLTGGETCPSSTPCTLLSKCPSLLSLLTKVMYLPILQPVACEPR